MDSKDMQDLRDIKKVVKDMLPITFRPFISRIGGKTRLADRIVKFIPPHKIYVEPFIGGGSVFLLQRSEVEIINDKDKDIYHLWLDLKAIGDQVKNMTFICDRKMFTKVRDSKPSSIFQRLFKNLYVTIFSFSGNRRGFVGEKECETRKNPGSNLKRDGAKYMERLKDVKIFNQDYVNMIDKFDSKDTFFYFDPPYLTIKGNWGFTPVIPTDLFASLRDIKGKFILSYEDVAEIKTLFSGNKYRIMPIITTYQFSGKRQSVIELLIMNF